MAGGLQPTAGRVPGPGERRPASLAGFGHGGSWAEATPSAALAVALEAAAGPEGLYEGADTGALVGIARQWAAVESWAAAGKLAALRAMMREDRDGAPLLRRRGDLPDGWDDSLTYEIAGALAMGPVSAGNLAGLAWTLGARLPGIGGLLADGTLTLGKARLVAAVFEPLGDDEAARAEALIAAEVAGKTYFQVERLAWRAALAVAPDVAERRRLRAERERARVTVFREESGAVGLSGRDLPGRAGSGGACQCGGPREGVRGVGRVLRADREQPGGPGVPAPAQRGERRRRDRVRAQRRRGAPGRRARDDRTRGAAARGPDSGSRARPTMTRIPAATMTRGDPGLGDGDDDPGGGSGHGGGDSPGGAGDRRCCPR